VFRAPADNLTARVVEDDHPVFPCGELLEEHEVADLEVVGDDGAVMMMPKNLIVFDGARKLVGL
jgi:hypothetical protein